MDREKITLRTILAVAIAAAVWAFVLMTMIAFA